MRVFLDANILFSAARSDGAVRHLLELLLAAGHECWADDFVVTEARRNLEGKAPAGVAALDRLLERVQVARISHDPELEASLPLPGKDQPVLASAIRHRCDFLVTGDRTHFGRLYGRTLDGVAIHSPRSLAETLLR